MNGYPARVDRRDPSRGYDYGLSLGLAGEPMEKESLSGTGLACEVDTICVVFDYV